MIEYQHKLNPVQGNRMNRNNPTDRIRHGLSHQMRRDKSENVQHYQLKLIQCKQCRDAPPKYAIKNLSHSCWSACVWERKRKNVGITRGPSIDSRLSGHGWLPRAQCRILCQNRLTGTHEKCVRIPGHDRFSRAHEHCWSNIGRVS